MKQVSGFYCWQQPRSPSVTFPFPVFWRPWPHTAPPGFSKLEPAIPKKSKDGENSILMEALAALNAAPISWQHPAPEHAISAVVPTPTSMTCCQWQLSRLGLGCDSSCISEPLHLLLILLFLLFFFFPGSCSLAFQVILWFPKFSFFLNLVIEWITLIGFWNVELALHSWD